MQRSWGRNRLGCSRKTSKGGSVGETGGRREGSGSRGTEGPDEQCLMEPPPCLKPSLQCDVQGSLW